MLEARGTAPKTSKLYSSAAKAIWKLDRPDQADGETCKGCATCCATELIEAAALSQAEGAAAGAPADEGPGWPARRSIELL